MELSAPVSAPHSRMVASRWGRRCQCTRRNWKQTDGTIQCHPLHNPHNLLRIGSNHRDRPLARGSARGSAKGVLALLLL